MYFFLSYLRDLYFWKIIGACIDCQYTWFRFWKVLRIFQDKFCCCAWKITLLLQCAFFRSLFCERCNWWLLDILSLHSVAKSEIRFFKISTTKFHSELWTLLKVFPFFGENCCVCKPIKAYSIFVKRSSILHLFFLQSKG